MVRTVVIMNDTRPDAHHGCDRVMSVLERKLAAAGVEVAGTSAVGADWWTMPGFLRALASAEGVVINGEGTFHHGSPRAEKLLRVLEHPARARKPVVLINALYQENPVAWREPLSRMRLICARDSRSADELSRGLGREVRWLPDLTLCDGALGAAAERHGIVVGDSANREVTLGLAALVRSRDDARLTPTVRRSGPTSGRYANPIRQAASDAVRNLKTLSARRRLGDVRWAPDQRTYAETLARARLHVTGRFHGVCFSLITATPFVCVASNSWKVEALLHDAGLSAGRLRPPACLTEDLRDPGGWAYSDAERAAIDVLLARARTDSDRLFVEIAALPD